MHFIFKLINVLSFELEVLCNKQQVCNQKTPLDAFFAWQKEKLQRSEHMNFAFSCWENSKRGKINISNYRFWIKWKREGPKPSFSLLPVVTLPKNSIFLGRPVLNTDISGEYFHQRALYPILSSCTPPCTTDAFQDKCILKWICMFWIIMLLPFMHAFYPHDYYYYHHHHHIITTFLWTITEKGSSHAMHLPARCSPSYPIVPIFFHRVIFLTNH